MGFFLSRLALPLYALIALAIGHQYYSKHYMNKGEAKVIEKSHTEGKKINAKIKKRTDAVKPGDAAKRLFHDYSRE